MPISLSKLSKHVPDLTELSLSMISLGNRSDREGIILGSGIIDTTLGEAIISSFSEKEPSFIKDLIDTGGPISTFSQKIKMARAIGLISKRVYHDLNKIREVRNICAHSIVNLEFESPPISDFISSLCVSDNFEEEQNTLISSIDGALLSKPVKSRGGPRGFRIGDTSYYEPDYQFSIDSENKVFAFIPSPDKTDKSMSRGKIISAMQSCWFLLMPLAILRLNDRSLLGLKYVK